MRFTRLLLLALALPLFAGCMEMKVEGDAKIFQPSDVGVMLWYVLSLGVLGFGVIGIWSGVSPYKKMNRPLENHERIPAWQRGVSILIGLALLPVGFVLLCLGLFSAGKTHVTVYPDRVAMSKSPFSKEEVIVPFYNVASVDIVEERTPTGKPNKVLVFTTHRGPPIKREAHNNETHAFETIREALAKYQALPDSEKKPIAVADSSSSNSKPMPAATEGSSTFSLPPPPGADAATTSPPSQPIAGVNITPDTSPGGVVLTPPPTVEPAPPKPIEYKLKRYPINIPVPEGYALVERGAPIEVGTKLSACFNTWSTVTVMAVNNDGTLTCSWDSFPGSIYKMERQDLVTPVVGSIPEPKPKPDLAAMRRDMVRRGEELQRKMETAPASPSSGQKEYTLKRYEITIALPPKCSHVKPGMPIEEGMKLGACYARRWESVTVVAVNDDDTITCNWDKWKGFTYKMLREDLIIQNKDIKKAKP